MLGRLYLSSNGRCSRAFYWQFYVIPFAVLGVLVGLLAVFLRTTAPIFVAVLLAIWPSTVIQIRRWHDFGASGWWALLGFIPVVSVLVWIGLGLIPADPGPNRFGPNPAEPHNATRPTL